MRAESVILCLVACLFLSGAVCAEDFSKKCAADFQKVTACLSFATGKANTPTKECCSSAKDIKDSDPECLCYFIQQVHSGSEQVKSLGIQEAKLLQLSSACALTNATVSNCPKLLGLDPKSPDAAIFSNNSSSPATPVSPATSSPTKSGNDSDGTKQEPRLVVSLVIALACMSLSLCGFPSGFASMF